MSKFVHIVFDLRNMAMCRRNLKLKLLKAMVEENDVLNELYGVIIMRKIQLSKRKHRFWIHNIIKKSGKGLELLYQFFISLSLEPHLLYDYTTSKIVAIQVMIFTQFTRGKYGKSDLHADFVCTFIFPYCNPYIWKHRHLKPFDPILWHRQKSYGQCPSDK